jgi:hypothetical protein
VSTAGEVAATELVLWLSAPAHFLILELSSVSSFKVKEAVVAEKTLSFSVFFHS